MEFIFIDAAGTTLFTRTDAESAHWIVQELSLTADFPYNPKKVIHRGQRIAFRSPVDDSYQVFEIRQVETDPTGSYQGVTAENIALAELSDEHIDNAEIGKKTAAQALATALNGTLWTHGTGTTTYKQSADFQRGSVWEAVNTIKTNWNVYIIPRVTFSAAGVINGRYLDIKPAGGTYNGLRLSIRKNMPDPIVTYNDEDVLTALYGYGGQVDKAQQSGDDKTEELTFKDVVWTATAEHPAKPSGQTYLEYPAKTALYGRNGRARFGFYQNSAITDANILLKKTWEALKKTCDPKIVISGTVEDLYRLGYADTPLRLHDTAIVEIEETGEVFQKEIIQLDYDLLDPSNNRVDIGDYIPNIVYINRNTNEKASGGGGGGRGQTPNEAEQSKTYAEFVKTNNMIGMVVGTRNGGYYVKAGEISLAINQSGESGSYESTATINADHINISGTSTVHTLAGDIEHDANGRLVIKNAGGLYVERSSGGTTAQFGIWDRGNLTGGVMVTQINGQSTLRLSADVIDINGIVNALTAREITVNALNCTNNVIVGGRLSGTVWASSLKVDAYDATWQSKSVVTSVATTSSYEFIDTRDQVRTGRLVTSISSETIHYLGF